MRCHLASEELFSKSAPPVPASKNVSGSEVASTPPDVQGGGYVKYIWQNASEPQTRRPVQIVELRQTDLFHVAQWSSVAISGFISFSAAL